MKAAVGFMFFMLFLAGLAFVNLRGMGGSAGVEVSSASELTGIRWRPTHIGEMPLPEDNSLFLQFEADGSLHGNAGCNRFSGEYDIADKLITPSPLAATRKACADAAAAFEIAYLDAVQAMRGAVRNNDRLAIRDRSGTVVSRFVAVHTVGDDEP